MQIGVLLFPTTFSFQSLHRFLCKWYLLLSCDNRKLTKTQCRSKHTPQALMSTLTGPLPRQSTRHLWRIKPLLTIRRRIIYKLILSAQNRSSVTYQIPECRWDLSNSTTSQPGTSTQACANRKRTKTTWLADVRKQRQWSECEFWRTSCPIANKIWKRYFCYTTQKKKASGQNFFSFWRK